MTALKKPKAANAMTIARTYSNDRSEDTLEVLKGKLRMYLDVSLDLGEGEELEMQLGCGK
jgi:hypothetical protein